jgi:threonine/homoserine/homoserine lactone efflux protein
MFLRERIAGILSVLGAISIFAVVVVAVIIGLVVRALRRPRQRL